MAQLPSFNFEVKYQAGRENAMQMYSPGSPQLHQQTAPDVTDVFVLALAVVRPDDAPDDSSEVREAVQMADPDIQVVWRYVE